MTLQITHALTLQITNAVGFKTLVGLIMDSDSNPTLTIENDQLVSKSHGVIFSGKAQDFKGIAKQALCRVSLDDSVEEIIVNITDIDENFVLSAYKNLPKDEQDSINQVLNPQSMRFLELLCYFLHFSVVELATERTDGDVVFNWISSKIDHDYMDLIKSDFLTRSLTTSLDDIFEYHKCKEPMTAFLKKYPHMIPMFRTIVEVHIADQGKNIFGNIQTLEDLEKGEFMVEKYNQCERYYESSYLAKKLLADSASWQWLVQQKSKEAVDIVIRKYTVNDSGKKLVWCYFSAVRENLSVIANLKVDLKIALAMLENYKDSIENDRFGIDIYSSKENDINSPEFHSGELYRNKVRTVFRYFDDLKFTEEMRISFIKTFSGLFSGISTNIWYIQEYKKENKSVNEIIEEWVVEKFNHLKAMNLLKKDCFVPY